jgi:hypothetical protein
LFAESNFELRLRGLSEMIVESGRSAAVFVAGSVKMEGKRLEGKGK